MIGFCGALDIEGGAVSLGELKRICGLHGVGSAYIGKEYGVLCDGEKNLTGGIMPFTVRYNNSLYTVAIITDRKKGTEADVAREVIEGYMEEGEEYINRLDMPYAMALYDGRCGELLLTKGHFGDKPLFYTVWNKAVYFCSSLRPLIRLWGGCVRVNKNKLTEYIDGAPTVLPEGLFCDIRPVRAGHRVICTRFGQSDITTPPLICSERTCAIHGGEELCHSGCPDMRRELTDALYAFDYPQFDYYMAGMLSRLRECRQHKQRSICVCDDALLYGSEYSAERAERLGNYFEVHISTAQAKSVRINTRTLKAMNRGLDKILDQYLCDEDNVLHKLFGADYFCRLNNAKPTDLTVRKKALLCQTAMWFERFDLVLQ